MNFTNVNGKVSQKSEFTEWSKALKTAVDRLAAIEAERTQLKAAIKFFEGKIKAGEPWPEEKTGTAA